MMFSKLFTRTPLIIHTHRALFCQQQFKMMKLVQRRLKQLSTQYKDLQKTLHDGQSKNPNGDRKKLNHLQPLMGLSEKVQACFENMKDLERMKAEKNIDKETLEFVVDEEKKIGEQLAELEGACLNGLIEPDLYDDYTEITMELRPAVGGSESSLFVEDVANMYLGYFQQQGWNSKIRQQQRDFSINKGYKFFSVKVTGEGVYKTMKCESGVHKVIRVPETELRGRLHSSTITVAVMPSVPFDFAVNDKDIRFDFMRASGAGGQHVNKTESACRATHIPTGLSVFIQEERVQERNRKRAVEILKQKIFQLEYNKNMEEESQRRKVQIGSGDRSEKIRTYNYPQDRITDHRTNLTLFGIENMLSGDYVQQFIDAYQQKINKIKLEELIAKLKQ